jgi:hypothetical protein
MCTLYAEELGNDSEKDTHAGTYSKGKSLWTESSGIYSSNGYALNYI